MFAVTLRRKRIAKRVSQGHRDDRQGGHNVEIVQATAVILIPNQEHVPPEGHLPEGGESVGKKYNKQITITLGCVIITG